MTTIQGCQFDSVGSLPFSPALRALYINGDFAARPVTYGRGRVWVDVTGADPLGAFWRDIEKGDGDPASFPRHLDARRHAGLGGGGYCSRATLPAMLEAAGERPWSLWLATLDGTADPSLIPELAQLPSHVTLIGIQALPASMLGFNADLTLILDADYWNSRHA